MLRQIIIPTVLIAVLMAFFVLPRYATALQYGEDEPSPAMQTILHLSAWAQANSWAFVAGILLLGVYLFCTSFGWFFQHLKNR
jgi:type II secretory pathway component PulF